jgi:hypothetical protein
VPATGGLGAGTGGTSADIPLLFDAGEDPFGLSHEAWLSQFWQWFLAMPKSEHPREGGDCSLEQSGSVWFLTTGHNGTIEQRSCTIPAGTSLFIPVTSRLIFPVPDCIPCGTEMETPAVWEANLEGELALAYEQMLEERVTFELDGRLLPVGVDYLWVGTDVFRVTPPTADAYFSCLGRIESNTCGWPVGSERPFHSVGYAAMLGPLPEGRHTLRFGAEATSWSWHTDVTYELQVLP